MKLNMMNGIYLLINLPFQGASGILVIIIPKALPWAGFKKAFSLLFQKTDAFVLIANCYSLKTNSK